MIPVATHHFLNITHRQILPLLIADVLPARNLFEHEQTILVTRIQEVRRLRIMRRAHNVALQLLLENPRIAFLHARRHRLADERKSLMSIETTELHVFAIQEETIRSETRFPKASTGRVFVNTPTI